ncbi:MAG TPA: 2,3-bisphosphoglycerate-independent phosphoglycerate mutase [Dehalococcoidia bacterium]|jgi:2,3-bisphosphoglycerate-independent phosphoglycerate mutase|nr:2,3-bisphosphoglycerate-independent phosphoglycerate mutase [Dehalococcoidia bacterium]
MDLELVRQLAQESDSKIVLFVMDGLGGLPHPETGRTELEAAWTPHLDNIARDSSCGFTIPVGIGITPGSGPGHLALFGYDPLVYTIGRGVLEATGIDFELQPSDVAARGNFCTIDGEGKITDRRAGRIPTEKCAELCAELQKIKLEGVQTFVQPVREHRFVLVLRGDSLSDEVKDTDPERLGAKPLAAEPSGQGGAATAALVNRWLGEAQKTLAGCEPANMLLLRGFARRPDWPSMPETFKLRAAAVAHYPMYRGLAKLVGMEALPVGPALEDSIATLRENWGRFDYFFVHYKYTDTAGEDGDYDRKVEKLTEVDEAIEGITGLEPDVLMITGDHSTPAIMASHSWHPVPFMLRSKWGRADVCESFNEVALLQGCLGTFPAKEALPLAMAHAGRLRKFGA